MRYAPWLLAAVVIVATPACDRHEVDVELPTSGRALTAIEQRELGQIAETTFRETRGLIHGLPPRLTLFIRWGKDVIAETGENGAAGFPGNIAWTLDPDRDVLSIIRRQLRPTLFHELHHLARAAYVPSRSLMDQVVTEGLATAFERDFGKVDPPWAQPSPEMTEWTRELLRQPADADRSQWLYRHPDGRRWIGMRVGTYLADRARAASGKTSAALVGAPTDEILRLADVR